IAPDGSAILFTVSRSNLAANRTDVDLLLLKPGDAAPLKLTTTASGVNSIRWAPDSRRFAFFGTNPATSTQALYASDATAPRETTYGFREICRYDRSNSFLSKAGNYLSWSPDGT